MGCQLQSSRINRTEASVWPFLKRQSRAYPKSQSRTPPKSQSRVPLKNQSRPGSPKTFRHMPTCIRLHTMYTCLYTQVLTQCGNYSEIYEVARVPMCKYIPMELHFCNVRMPFKLSY